MTPKEASYILRKFYADGYKSNNYNTLEQALQLAVMCLENIPHWISVEFPHWISVEDEMPKDGVYVLTVNKFNFQVVCFRFRGHWFSRYGNEYNDITHWMQISPPPKKGGEK